jgi:hypothetical protein
MTGLSIAADNVCPRFGVAKRHSARTGHEINLDEPEAFDAHAEGILSAVERGSWRQPNTDGPAEHSSD